MPLELLKLATRSLVNGLAFPMISGDPRVQGSRPIRLWMLLDR